MEIWQTWIHAENIEHCVNRLISTYFQVFSWRSFPRIKKFTWRTAHSVLWDDWIQIRILGKNNNNPQLFLNWSTRFKFFSNWNLERVMFRLSNDVSVCRGCPSLGMAGAIQTETSLLKQYAAGDCVDLLDDYDFPARTITETCSVSFLDSLFIIKVWWNFGVFLCRQHLQGLHSGSKTTQRTESVIHASRKCLCRWISGDASHHKMDAEWM